MIKKIENNDNRTRKAVFVTLIGLFINICLAGLKLFVGLAAASGALIADAIHSLSDLTTDLVVLGGIFIARKPADKCHPFGHGKGESLAAALIGVILFIVALGIMKAGIDKIVLWLAGEALGKPGVWAFYVALASLFIKEGLFRYTIHQGKKIQSASMIANAWHQRSDALSSLGAAMGIAGAAFLGESWRVLDPIASIAVGGCIILAAFGILRQSIHQLMDGAADESLSESALKALNNAACVKNPHDLAVWNLAGRLAVIMHVEVRPETTAHQVQVMMACLEKQIRAALGQEVLVTIRPEAALQNVYDIPARSCQHEKEQNCDFLTIPQNR